ncbi:MAG: type II secretion system F family protein [Deltaproteobacteria bacterium]|nr:type II secretion system F family protein [Deltaproteobacteria bacterium]
MPVYSYRALNAKGKTVRGVVDAESPQRARSRLRVENLFPVKVTLTTGTRDRGHYLAHLRRLLTVRRNVTAHLTPITRQLATLLAAGLPLVQALDTVQEQTDDNEFSHVLALVKDQITSGSSLADALETHSNLFSPEYVHMVRAGELSGALGPVLKRLAEGFEQRQTRRAKISSALTYPAFMTIIGVGVLIFVLSFIVPTMTGLFEDLGEALPWPTRLLLATSALLKGYWWVLLLGLILLVVLVIRYLRNEDHYRFAENVVFRIPVIGRLIKEILLARVLRSMALLTTGGVPLVSALQVTSRGMGRSNFATALDTARQQITQGRSLAEGLISTRLFPPLVTRMVTVGEAGGALQEMLERLAQTYEEETERAMTSLTSLVEPVIIVTMGFGIGFMMLAVLLPIFELSGLVG